jgi:photosystem II stability/assembly factor-like uncharacterized protein
MQKNARNQKIRHEVAIQRFAFPLRDAAPRDLEEFWEKRHAYPQAANADWKDAGPCNFSGRVTCLAIDPANPQRLFAGSAAGGLWKSEDEGNLWTSCWPNSLNQNIGAVAIDPDNSSVIICATGEGNLATASYPGSGIYVSRDGGLTWRSFIYIAGKMASRMTSRDREIVPRRVSAISIGPTITPGLRPFAFSSISNEEDLAGGLYRSRRNGSLRFETRWSSRPYNCYSAVYHPTRQGTLFAAIEAGGTTNGIWRTTDDGETWQQLTAGLPSGEQCGRISLAISNSHPDRLLALISTRPSGGRKSGNKGQRVLGVFRSQNGGELWEKHKGDDFDAEGQLAFNNTIAIHPENPDIAICGAQNLFLTRDGGIRWESISDGKRGLTAEEPNPRYVHPDQHAIVFAPGNVVYSGNDGGVARGSFDKNWKLESWRESSHGMSTIMFYAIDVSPANAQIYGGGSQDNGTLLAGVKDRGAGLRQPGDLAFTQVLKGDGGYLVCDPTEEELVFASTFETTTKYHPPGQPWADGLLSELWPDASPKVSADEADVLGLTVMAIRPATADSPRKLFLGTNRLWRATIREPKKRGRNWKADWRTSKFSFFDGSAVSAIEVAAAKPSVMYLGTAFGGIFRSEDGGRNWTEDLAGPEIPNRVITQIETHPTDARIVVVTVASTSRSSLTAPYSHVFRSVDSGQTWEDIDKGQLPNVVVNGLAFETHSPHRIFVAGDAGPWMLGLDDRWISIAGNMPSSVISDIIYHAKSRTLFAGTYGRGMWCMKVPKAFDILPGEPGLDSDSLLPPIEGFQLDRRVPVPRPLSPADNEMADPDNFTYACASVKGALGYYFESISKGGFPERQSSRKPRARVRLGDRSVHTWRCWALMPNGRCSFPSPVRTVRFGAPARPPRPTRPPA